MLFSLMYLTDYNTENAQSGVCMKKNQSQVLPEIVFHFGRQP